MEAQFVEFNIKDVQIKTDFKKGEIYCFMNEHGYTEIGECIDFDKETGKLKLQIIIK